MEFRKATLKDVPQIMNIIYKAQENFRIKGIDQWQNNYPNEEIIIDDINKGYGFVLSENDYIIGYVAISFDGEETYNKIYDGQWLSNGEYAVIHRIAINENYKGRGYSYKIMENVEKYCKDNGVYSIKVDTHIKNIPMQRIMERLNYIYCGKIYLKDGSERIAFEKLLDHKGDKND
jgi:RimJ/RimL family protein N-acetyltransferase